MKSEFENTWVSFLKREKKEKRKTLNSPRILLQALTKGRSHAPFFGYFLPEVLMKAAKQLMKHYFFKTDFIPHNFFFSDSYIFVP